MKNLFNLLVFSLLSVNHMAQNIVSGPMLGYNTMTEVAIWIQCDSDVPVQVICSERVNPDSTIVSVMEESGNFAHIYEFKVSHLKPGTTYQYYFKVGDRTVVNEEFTFTTQALWQFRNDPPEFSMALGSCTYVNEKPYDRPGRVYGGEYQIFTSIRNANPDLMLWLGDNIYLREVDWSSKSGYTHRYAHTRSIPEIQALLSSTHHYAIWDDHDFGPNDANGSWIHKDWALESFDLFWANPTTGIPDLKGITTAFRFNDIDYFLLDNRYHRTSDALVEGTPQILGKEQIEWLIQNLKYSRAPFKIIAVGGQVLNSAPVYETHAVYSEERKYLIRRIVEEEIEGVVFVTGDRHHSELSKYEDESGIIIYDLTVSPLTSGTHKDDNEPNNLRVDNTLVNDRNFAIVKFIGKRGARQMKISIFDSDGEEIWNKTIDQK